jgi:hypothetical protein
MYHKIGHLKRILECEIHYTLRPICRWIQKVEPPYGFLPGLRAVTQSGLPLQMAISTNDPPARIITHGFPEA